MFSFLKSLFSGNKSDDPTFPVYAKYDDEFENLKDAIVGDYIDLWPRPESTIIHVYLKGSVGGSGQIGILERRQARKYQEHIGKGDTVKAKIVEVYSNGALLEWDIIDAEKRLQQQIDKQSNFMDEIKKPYNPKKPLVFKFSTELKQPSTIEIGDKVVLKLEDEAYYLASPENINRFNLEIPGKYEGESLQSGTLKKLIRAKKTGYALNAAIVNVGDEHSYDGDYWNSYEIQVNFIKAD